MKQTMIYLIAGAITGLSLNAMAIDYAKDIQPIFDNSCVKCHKAPYESNGRIKKPKAGLRMDTYEEVMKGSSDGAVIKPGDPDNSSVYTLSILPSDHDDVMPPEDKADPLTDAQKKLLHDWIKAGAKK